jgi:ADP-ribosylglycohydrolase
LLNKIDSGLLIQDVIKVSLYLVLDGAVDFPSCVLQAFNIDVAADFV